MIKYDYKQCDKCGNKENFEWRGCGGGLPNDDYYDAYICKKCGERIKVYHKAKEEEPDCGVHDGGWDDM